MDKRRITDHYLLFSAIGGDQFAEKVAKAMDLSLSPVKHIRFEGVVPGGGETKPEVLTNVSGRECVVIWSVANTNDEFVRVCLLLQALKKAEASRITLVVPCFPYARQDKNHGRREPESARWVANVLELSGMNRIIYVDIHADQIGSFFKAPVRSLWMDAVYVDYLGKILPVLAARLGIGLDKIRMMTPDEGAVGSNYRVAKILMYDMAVHLKKRDWSKVHSVTSLGIAGDVFDCLVCERDDLCASGDSLLVAAAQAKARGAKYVMAIVAHTLGFDKPDDARTFVQKLNASELDLFVTTNSVAAFAEKVLATPEMQQKITILDISPYIAHVLNRLRLGQTVREMMPEERADELYRVDFCSLRLQEILGK